VTVRGLLDAAPEGLADPLTVEAPAPLFPARRAIWPWLAVVAAILALGGVLAWSWIRSRRSGAPGVVQPELPPEVIARRALAELRAARLDSEAAVEAYYVAVSQVLRVYLERRFGLHAPERTTEEFLPEIERSGVLAPAQCRELRRFLTQCDLVKFAALHPGADVHGEVLATATDLVDRTAERETEAEAVV
jgi:hypothetical protein